MNEKRKRFYERYNYTLSRIKTDSRFYFIILVVALWLAYKCFHYLIHTLVMLKFLLDNYTIGSGDDVTYGDSEEKKKNDIK